ncbi:hypothetical protein RDI58_024776 [Solanum bulbocastanum]|uniref:Uncharacterized protein n=1 Tax=Solanum bulbocastanum TaxID=147425 RepID=A0AAN8T5J7_SOLBU
MENLNWNGKFSKSLQSAAESDSVWERFLPSVYQSINSASLTTVPDFVSKKDLYVYLCRHPLLIDAGRKGDRVAINRVLSMKGNREEMYKL